jgi:hypothetical protein
MSTPGAPSGAGLQGFRGPILHFFGDPLTTEPENNYEYLEDGMLVVALNDGKVVACKDAAEAINEFGHRLELVDCSDKVRTCPCVEFTKKTLCCVCAPLLRFVAQFPR